MTPLDVELIGLSGYAGAGKDEVAKVLGDCAWRRASFADPLRAALYALDPFVEDFRDNLYAASSLADLVDEFGWDVVKRSSPEVRALLQRMGTEVGRNLFGADFWVDRAFADITADGGTRYAFADARFPNEAEAIRSRGGRVWRITRSGVGPATDPSTGEVHISETALDDYPFDGYIDNDGTLDDLHDRVLAELVLDWRHVGYLTLDES